MAILTDSERHLIRSYLGWSFRFRQTDSRLEQALNAVDQDATVLADVRVQLTAVTAHLALFSAAYGRLAALKVGSIQLSGPGEIAVLRSEGRRLVGRLASTLGVEVRHDIFGGFGPRNFAGPGRMGPGTSGGNLPPLG